MKLLNILTINDQYTLEVMVFVNKFINNNLPTSFVDLYKFNHEVQLNHATRQSQKLHIQRCPTVFSSKLPLYIYPIIWNSWNFSDTSSTFPRAHIKSRVRSLLISKYREVVHCSNPYCRDCAIR